MLESVKEVVDSRGGNRVGNLIAYYSNDSFQINVTFVFLYFVNGWLFGPFRYMIIQIVWLIVKIISIPDEELFSETAVGCTASYFVKII